MQVNLTKILLYVVLTVMAVYSGRQFIARYSLLMSSNVTDDPIELIDTRPPADRSPAAAGDTNVVEVPGAGSEPVTASDTSTPTLPDSDQPAAPETNEVAASVTPPAPESEPVMMTKRGLERGTTAPDTSGIAFNAFALFASLICLGFLIAHDVSTLIGQKTHKLLNNEDAEGIHSVDYDQAEDVWANGDYLEAIRMMREYLEKNPREVHVMARIAEIYEKDLGNFLAAALEYEEFLKHKLPPERWGWAAIHLVNLYYGKLDKPTQGLALLWRIHREYGNTQAAVKARKRLNQIDPDFAVEQARLDREAAEAEAEAESESESESEEEVEEPASPLPAARAELIDEPEAPAWEEPDGSSSHLPKGFRPKKR